MALISYIDGPNRRIYLSADTIGVDVHPIDVYKEMRTLRRTDEALRSFDVFLTAYGNVDKGGGKATERYVQCMSGTRIVPFDTTHVLTIIGTIITDDGLEGVYCFDRSLLTSSTTVDINYIPPQVEIITISTGGATPQSLWEYNERTLTSGAASGDVNVVSVNGITVTSPSDFGASASEIVSELLNTDVTLFTQTETIGEAIFITAFLSKSVYVDTDALINGDGCQTYPFNNVNDAKDFAELSGIKNIIVAGDVVVPQNIKNVNIHGIGLAKVNLNGQDASGSKFTNVYLSGDYTGSIIAQECQIGDGFIFDGHFETCELMGDHFIRPEVGVSLINCLSGIPGISRPTISANSSLPTYISIRSWRGGLTIKDFDHVDDVISVGVAEGSLTFDSSCTLGTMVARGTCLFIDETNGATVIDETTHQTKIDQQHTYTKNTVIAMS